MKLPVLLLLVRKRIGVLLFFLVALQVPFHSQAQSVAIGSFADEALRRLQLQGKISADYSMMTRPYFCTSSFTTDSLYRLVGDDGAPRAFKKEWGMGTVELLPLTITEKFNSHHPYGWNQSGLMQAKGLQTRLTTGVLFHKGFFSIQFKPEFVTAGNPVFEHNALFGSATTSSYHKFFAGQSSVRVSHWGISLGLSTENLWWGPGVYNSLLMSNNAPGFGHITFNTTRPIKTPIGSFEWQVIMGKLVEDPSVPFEIFNLTTSYYNPENYHGAGNSGPYDPKQKWRYLNGLTVTFQPRWIKGLYLGINRVAHAYNYKLQQYGRDFDFFHKYFPTIFGAFRENYSYGSADTNHAVGYKQIASVHARYLFAKSHAEVYFEYGVNDNAYNLRDLSIDPQHSAAYTMGFKKLKPLSGGKWLDISGEITRMAEQVDYLVRTAGDWYLYQGSYTNQNRIIGAGIGTGNNAQTLRIMHIDGFKKIGGIVQAVQHRPTQIVGGLSNLGIRDERWNDIALGLIAQCRYKRLIVGGEWMLVHSSNYIWEQGNKSFNFYGLLNISYIW